MAAGPSFIIRPAVIGDAEAIGEDGARSSRLISSRWAEMPATASRRSAFVRMASARCPPSRASSPSEDGALLGYLLHHPGYATDLAQRYLVVCDLFVREAGRRQGVGRALMSAARAHCVAVGGSGLFWSVMKANKTALCLLSQIGRDDGGGLPNSCGCRRHSCSPTLPHLLWSDAGTGQVTCYLTGQPLLVRTMSDIN